MAEGEGLLYTHVTVLLPTSKKKKSITFQNITEHGASL